MKYKVGDKVQLKGTGESVTVTNVEEGYGYNFEYTSKASRYKTGACGAGGLEPLVKTWDNLEYGDVIVGGNNDELIVQGWVGDLLFYMNGERHGYTSKSYAKENWTIKQPTSEDMTEMTLEEVAKLRGVPVERLRIKKED